jgi:hypothetical protein
MLEGQGLKDLMETKLVTKVNTAFDLMADQRDQAPAILQFVGAKKLARGGVLYHINLIEATN